MEVENPSDASEKAEIPESNNSPPENINGTDSDSPKNKSGLSDDNVSEILNHIQKCPATFCSQQIGDPELSETKKREIAGDLLNKSQFNFLTKFGRHLKENHLDYFLSASNSSYEIEYYVKQLKSLLNDGKVKVIKKNRRFEALKRLEEEGNYFSEAEMERREPLLYHQLIGQFLSEKEKAEKKLLVGTNEQLIPTFSSFLIQKMEEDQLDNLRKSQQEAEDNLKNNSPSDEEEDSKHSSDDQQDAPRWGEDWIDVEKRKEKKKTKKKREKKVNLSSKEKNLLMDEFKSIMQSKFINGLDVDFDYSTVDSNPEYDCLQVRSQDEEEKYFDEETCDNEICTDTGIEDY